MSDPGSDDALDEKIIEDELRVSPETAKLIEEDQLAWGARKPSSDAVEQERIAKANAEEAGSKD
jgi:hypothetical protein